MGVCVVECGGDIWCEVSTWLVQNGFITKTLAALVGDQLRSMPGVIGGIGEELKKNAEAYIALVSVSFNLLQFYWYHDKRLHARLRRYLDRSDSRLSGAYKDVIQTIRMPEPRDSYDAPLYAVQPLKRLLKRNNWEPIIKAPNTLTSADRLISRSVKKIDDRILIAKKSLKSLHHQTACAHVIKGAIASARASRLDSNSGKSVALHAQALQQFRAALKVPGYERDPVATELQAHQWRQMGKLDEAEKAYRKLAGLATRIEDEGQRCITLARSKRYQAEILQARTEGGAGKARTLLAEALQLRSQLGSLTSWAQIEQAEIHYVFAYVRFRLNENRKETNQLSDCRDAYDSVIRETSVWSLPFRPSLKRLRRAARNGLKRVKSAEKGNYDTAWLLPPDATAVPSNNPQDKPKPIGPAGGDEGVPEAP